MQNAVISYYRNYFNFRGRTSKNSFLLARRWVIGAKITAIVICICVLVANIGNNFFVVYPIVLISYVIWWALHIIPSMALGVRRYHDVGRKGWGYLGEKLLWYVIFAITRAPSKSFDITSSEGEPEENEYGPVPVD